MDNLSSNIETSVRNYKRESRRFPTMAIVTKDVPTKSPQSIRSLQNRETLITQQGNIPVYKINELNSQIQELIREYSSGMKTALVLGTKRLFPHLNHRLNAYELNCEPSTLAQCL